MKILKKLLLVLLLIFVVAQFFGPEKNEGDLVSLNAFYEETNPSDNVKLILKEACLDCHSNVTRYPWYSKITPVNYWMAEHVNNGKRHFNVSNWDTLSVKRKDHKFEELIEMVEDKEMPLESYTWGHPEAKLTDTQIKDLIDWAKQVRQSYTVESH
ncbi:cytochrome C [Meridianimaribacter sp. CL38]|uniref:heme-binding domain-containing protein n=1 Tax=Meridianimaribacter sp. CL38 TaxID=2213021 RepID=UPI00103D71AA|nr:heme-binding domain-containing protein [Meridianimaribacter sp. CL38]TBV25624.1 cytochrome C [Meridianimaribacter sp. CL38]